MAKIQARYRGTCAETGRRIRPGDWIEYERDTRRAVLCDPPADDETGAESPGEYLARRTRAGSVSDVFTTSGGTFYRNKRGRCEDAPCCGCCTI